MEYFSAAASVEVFAKHFKVKGQFQDIFFSNQHTHAFWS